MTFLELHKQHKDINEQMKELLGGFCYWLCELPDKHELDLGDYTPKWWLGYNETYNYHYVDQLSKRVYINMTYTAQWYDDQDSSLDISVPLHYVEAYFKGEHEVLIPEILKEYEDDVVRQEKWQHEDLVKLAEMQDYRLVKVG